MKLLVLTENYPNNQGCRSMNYVHMRNKKYLEEGIETTVLSFSTDVDYVIEGINVISLSSFLETKKDYTDIVCHAPNVRHHFVFISKYRKYFNNLILIFHGHEILKINKYYPKPYHYRKKKIKRLIQSVYDVYKMNIWKKLIQKNEKKNHYIFVSDFLKRSFFNDVGIKEAENCYIINNSVGYFFENESYNGQAHKKYDFITIRNNLDESTYCMDLIYEFAKKNIEKKFLVIGKGSFFNYNKKLDNITWINKELSHEELGSLMDESKVALMPTRHDSQGVMCCEMATYGIPVITSDIFVCREIFESFTNVYLIKNTVEDLTNFIQKGLPTFQSPLEKNSKYFAIQTVKKEISFLKKLEE